MANKKQQEAAEMEALKRMTPAASQIEEQKPAPKTDEEKAKSIGVLKDVNKPSFNRDERLNQLQYIEVNKDIMLYKGKFYPESWTFKCRAALGAEVAAFSTIDNEDPLSVNDGINELLKTCLRISDKNGNNISWQNIYEFDRLFFLLFIRDLTMANPEQKIVYNERCPHCGEINEVSLSFDNMVEIPVSELAQRYWDPDTNAFMVATRSFGVLKFQPSTIKRANIFKDYMVDAARKNQQNPSPAFMKMFWMFMNSDVEKQENAVKAAYMNFIQTSNDVKKFSLYARLEKELQLGLTQEIKYRCEHCERECRGQIQFPDGIQSLFYDTDISSELL